MFPQQKDTQRAIVFECRFALLGYQFLLAREPIKLIEL
jgi:hypothetical protein